MKAEWRKDTQEVASPEELRCLAEKNGITLTEVQAQKAYAQLHAPGELSDEELGNVAGGCSQGLSAAKQIYVSGFQLGYKCSKCGYDCWRELYASPNAKWWQCDVCYKTRGEVSRICQPGRDLPSVAMYLDV